MVFEKIRSGSESKLPEGWTWIKVGDIAARVNPGFPSGKHNKEGRGVPHIRPMNISAKGEIDLSEVKFVEVSDYDHLMEGDILFNNTNSPALLGKTTYIKKDTDWAYSNHMTRIRLLDNLPIKPAWLAYSLHHLFETGFFSMHCRHHVNQASINTTFLTERVSIPLPPFSQQKRIVEKIEELFSQLDAGINDLRRVQANLARYKASVLKAACEGRLVPAEAELARAEGREYESGEALLQRLLAERRKKWEEEQRANGKDPNKLRYKEPESPDTEDLPEPPEGWVWAKIDQLLETERAGMKTGPFGTLLKKKDHREEGIPVIGIENIGTMKFIPGSKIHISEKKANQLATYDVKTNDIIISRSGTVGEVAIIPEGLGEARLSTNVMRVTLAPLGMLPESFALLFNGDPMVMDQVSDLCKGSTRNFLNQRILKSIVFPLAPLNEQKRIIIEIERKLSIIQEMETTIEVNLKRASRLRQTVLKRAFEGKLVPQDLEDEPTEVLLEGKREGNYRERWRY